MPFWKNIASPETLPPSQLFHNENRIQTAFTPSQSNLAKCTWQQEVPCLRKETVVEDVVASGHIFASLCTANPSWAQT